MTYIKVRNVSKQFVRRGQLTQALSDIDLDIDEGSFVSFIGPSGCGKSTLLRIIGGLADIDGGDISIGDRTPSEMQAAKQFGFVPQAPALFPWRTVLENMKLPFEVNRRNKLNVKDQEPHLIELLKSVGLGDFQHSYPKELSGGMKQRVGIARAFATDAPILLMDEPFSALDEITRELLMLQLMKIWELHKKTVIFVTHSLQEAVYLSDKVVVMTSRPGKISTIIDIGLPRKRDESIIGTEDFLHYVSKVRHALRERWE
ncbi:MAG: ABC transporter ATP-binding protein [Cohnella sp.]|nr:ABC transporter ATP-binding protein [Cohnella sp.]